MPRNTLEVTEQAVALWRSLHGNESLDQQCQRFDGYYWQWAWAGSEKGIISYPTATAAANASVMYSRDINEPGVQPGDLANWWWNPEGHVGTVIGRDEGGVLVSHTSSKGDTVASFSNNVKISHADTIGLKFRGYSATNGANARRTGLAPWPDSTSSSAKFAEEEDDDMPDSMYAVVDGVPSWCILNWSTGKLYAVHSQAEADWMGAYMGSVRMDLSRAVYNGQAVTDGGSALYKNKLAMFGLLAPSPRIINEGSLSDEDLKRIREQLDAGLSGLTLKAV